MKYMEGTQQRLFRVKENLLFLFVSELLKDLRDYVVSESTAISGIGLPKSPEKDLLRAALNHVPTLILCTVASPSTGKLCRGPCAFRRW